MEEGAKFIKNVNQVNKEMGRRKGTKLKSLPDPRTYKIDPKGGYLYYVDNETVDGIEFPYIPDSEGQPIICDMTSNFPSR